MTDLDFKWRLSFGKYNYYDDDIKYMQILLTRLRRLYNSSDGFIYLNKSVK